MNKEELSKLSPGELTDLGICPTCFNRENGGALYGDNSDKMLYEDEDILLLNKPAGVLTQKAKPEDLSLNEWLIGHLLATDADHINEKIIRFAKRFMKILCEVYGCERVYLCTMCDGLNNHYHIQLIPRYPDEKRGSQNFVKPRKAYVPDHAKLEKVRTRIHEYAQE